jgi:hypothetical protein
MGTATKTLYDIDSAQWCPITADLVRAFPFAGRVSAIQAGFHVDHVAHGDPPHARIGVALRPYLQTFSVHRSDVTRAQICLRTSRSSLH